jgi:hypothetical protein
MLTGANFTWILAMVQPKMYKEAMGLHVAIAPIAGS